MRCVADGYDELGMLAYGRSKAANVLFAVELDRRWSRDEDPRPLDFATETEPPATVVPHAVDPELAARLWELSDRLLDAGVRARREGYRGTS
ncbi:hypothetical protein LY13_001361 [Prauserella aidingensis]|uniref:hypothetical protein n=1 Tax=Prauserella aidingensis TaxID=387890 RepID=UPI0020A2F46E|nr:hypothetical protein [Prauserella aidingensis]MCP2252618.1 hypothetical protein [Prauserella aidingensis]